MRFRYLVMLGAFILIVIFLPFFVEVSYNVECPIIIWSFSQSDILNYSSAVIGVIIAMLALFLAIDENRVKIKFDIANTVDDDGDLCFLFRTINSSKVYCKVEQFGLSCMYKPIKVKLFTHMFLFHRLKGQKRMHVVLSPPFELQPNECHKVIVKYKEIKSKIEQLYDRNEKIELFVSFVTWKHFYKIANEIRRLIELNYSKTETTTNE